MKPRVLLADDHQGVADALKRILSTEFDLVGFVEDGVALVHEVARLEPDVVVADISMPLLDGLAALEQLKMINPKVKVVFVTMHHDPAFADLALDSGALGFVLKYGASDELIPAVRAALDGKTYRSPALSKTA